METCRRFCIGMDFGTTFSGVFIMPDNGTAGSPINLWSGSTGQVVGLKAGLKAPTRLSLHRPAEGVGRWGFQVSHEEESFQWFKLGLMHPDDLLNDLLDDRDMSLPAQLVEAEALRHQYHTGATTLAEAYLKHLWAYILEVIESRYRVPKDQIPEWKLHVVIGVPANWNRAAVGRLQDCVQAAGVLRYTNGASSLGICTEPEAAATALVERGHVSANLTSGDIITVCDCGGGTADAVSYLIVPTQPFQLDECTPGRARFYGPVLLDGAFQKRLEQKVQVAAAPNAVPQKRMRSLYLLVWEKQIKPHFDDSAKKYTEDILVSRAGQRVNLRSSSISVAFTGHQLAIPSDELRELFDPTVQMIKDLLGVQMVEVLRNCNKSPKSVIVCGGFSASPYLRKRLLEQIDDLNLEYANDQLSGLIRFEVAEPVPSIQAVALGCAMRAFGDNCQNGTAVPSIRVASRVARVSYGVGSARRNLRQIVVKGNSLPVEPPMRVRLHLPDFSVRSNASVISLNIFQDQGASTDPRSMTTACDMSWDGDGAPILYNALQGTNLVELAVVSSGYTVNFELYIDNMRQTPGGCFTVDYAMH